MVRFAGIIEPALSGAIHDAQSPMKIKSAPLTDLVRIFGQRFVEDRCIQIASSLTFTSLLALVPIITVALTIVSAFPVFESLIVHLQRFK